MTRGNAIKQLKRMKIDMSHTGDEYNAIVEAIRALEQVPTDDATLRDIFCLGCEYKEQEPKTGHWIPVYPPADPRDNQKCSECGQIYLGATRYCPDCGAKMVDPQESEETE